MLFLYAYNIDEVLPGILFMPVIIASVLAVTLFFFFRLITKENFKSGLITTILFTGFYVFGKTQDVFTGYFINNKIVLFVFLLFVFVYLLWRFSKALLKAPSEETTKRIAVYLYSLIGIFLLHILTSYFIGMGFSVFRLILLFTVVLILFIGFYFVLSFKSKLLISLLPNLQTFLTITMLSAILYVVIYQCGFKGVTHRKLISPIGSFLIFILAFIYYVRKEKVKKYTLFIITTLELLFLFFLIYKHINELNFNLLPELAGCLLLVSITLKIIYSANSFEKVNSILNITLIILVALPVFGILKYEIIHHNDKNSETIPIKLPGYNNFIKKDLPPIYYIILDEYASSGTIKELFNYDNTPFTEALVERGFYVNDWETTSEHTHEVIASVLNLGYHKRDASARENFRAIQNNFVTNYLKKLSYKIVQYPAWRYERYFLIQNADTLIKVPKIGIRAKLEDFNSKILYSTILRRYISQNKSFYRTAVNNIFSSVTEIHKAYSDKPFFVYAHIICPHAPFVFDRHGNDIGIQSDGNRFYLGQYIYINNKVLELVDKLQQIHDGHCVIIVQSDHGPREVETGLKTSSLQKHQIFNAIYLPDKNYSGIERNVSININTFAILFNMLFNDSITLRPVENKPMPL